MNGRDHFERCELWIAAVDVVAADDDIFEAFGAPLVGDVASEFVVAGGAGDVRFSGEDVMLAALFVGGRDRLEFVFDLSFVSRRRAWFMPVSARHRSAATSCTKTHVSWSKR